MSLMEKGMANELIIVQQRVRNVLTMRGLVFCFLQLHICVCLRVQTSAHVDVRSCKPHAACGNRVCATIYFKMAGLSSVETEFFVIPNPIPFYSQLRIRIVN